MMKKENIVPRNEILKTFLRRYENEKNLNENCEGMLPLIKRLFERF